MTAAFLQEHHSRLSRSARHAKWIHSTDHHEDHPGQTLATRHPRVIMQWAKERKGRPATTPGGNAESPRVLRIDFATTTRACRKYRGTHG
jgi:hypothetical protein